jgi:predicted nucleic acid-binding Zn ribbon protein
VRYFKDGKLFIEAENSIWAYELSINKEKIIEKLNEKLSKPVIIEIITR